MARVLQELISPAKESSKLQAKGEGKALGGTGGRRKGEMGVMTYLHCLRID